MTGEFVCLLGPRGCGKSTILKAISGFIDYEGNLRAAGQVVEGPDLTRGVVFQSSEVLFPWLTIRENVEYALRLRGVLPDVRRARAEHYLSMVGLGHAADRRPAQLSGGMRQRAQIARVLINEPSIVLMDEPFGALDAQTREVLQLELDRIWRSSGCTIVFVTHDIWEAVQLADRIVVMTAGPAATVKLVETIDLPRPRDPGDSRFIAKVQMLREEIAAEVKKALQQSGVSLGR